MACRRPAFIVADIDPEGILDLGAIVQQNRRDPPGFQPWGGIAGRREPASSLVCVL